MEVLEFPALEQQATVDFFHHRAELAAQDFFGRPRPDLASDLAQDGLLKAHVKLCPGGRIERPGAWLRRIYKNRLIDLWRSERSRPEHVSISSLRSLFSDPDSSPMPRELADPGSGEVSKNRIRVSEALEEIQGQLSERQQKIFEYGLEGLTQREIAELLDLSPAMISAEVRAIERVIRTLWPPDDGGGGAGGGSAGRSTWIKRLHGKSHPRRTNGKGGVTMGHVLNTEILVSELSELGRLLCELPVFDHDGVAARAAAGRPSNLAEVVAQLAPGARSGEPVDDEEPDQGGRSPERLLVGPGGAGEGLIRAVRVGAVGMGKTCSVRRLRDLLVEIDSGGGAGGGLPWFRLETSAERNVHNCVGAANIGTIGHIDHGSVGGTYVIYTSGDDPPSGWSTVYHNLARFFDPVTAGGDATEGLVHVFDDAGSWPVRYVFDIFAFDHDGEEFTFPVDKREIVYDVKVGLARAGIVARCALQAVDGKYLAEVTLGRWMISDGEVTRDPESDAEAHLVEILDVAGRLLALITAGRRIGIGEQSDLEVYIVGEEDAAVDATEAVIVYREPGRSTPRPEHILAILGALQRGGQNGDGEPGAMTATVTGDGLAVLTRRGNDGGTGNLDDSVVVFVATDQEVPF